MTGIKKITSPSSLALRIKKALEEFPRLNIMIETRNKIKGIFRRLLFCLIFAEVPFPGAVSLTNFIKNMATAAGTTDSKKTRRTLLLKKNKMSIAIIGPPIAPILSIAL